LEGEAAAEVTGSPHAVTIRPEKIHMSMERPTTAPGEVVVEGQVDDVVYLGAFTRYVVALDLGGHLVVVQQNLRTSSMEVLQVRGSRVWLSWERQFARPVDQHHAEGSLDPEEENG
jgi:ABC-type Fe3+/spermidine/putrescine transport system ATPase subunit